MKALPSTSGSRLECANADTNGFRLRVNNARTGKRAEFRQEKKSPDSFSCETVWRKP